MSNEQEPSDENDALQPQMDLPEEPTEAVTYGREIEHIGQWLTLRIARVLATYEEVDTDHVITLSQTQTAPEAEVKMAAYIREALFSRFAEEIYNAGEEARTPRITIDDIQKCIERILDNPDAKQSYAHFAAAHMALADGAPAISAPTSIQTNDSSFEDEEYWDQQEVLMVGQYVADKLEEELLLLVHEANLQDSWPAISQTIESAYQGICIARVGDATHELSENRRLSIDIRGIRRDARNLLLSFMPQEDESGVSEADPES